MHITASAVILGGDTFLAEHGGAMGNMLAALIGNVKEAGMLLLLPVLEVALLAAPARGLSAMELSLQRLLAMLLRKEESGMVRAGAAVPTLCTLGQAMITLRYRL